MLTKAKKIELVEELSKIIKNNPNILFVDFTGLKMGEMVSLKKDLKKEGIGFKALKKSLLEFAFSAQGGSASGGKDSFDLSWHKSSVAIVYGSTSLTTGGPLEPNPDRNYVSDGASSMAKILHSFSVKSKKLAILGGFLIGEKMMKDKVIMLAQIPSREVLLAQFLQLLMSPVSGLARVLSKIKS